MWLVLDQFSRTLMDAAVANAILLSLVVVAVVFTRQPARRIILTQTGVYAALLMVPLVSLDWIPRVYPVDGLFRTGLVPPSLTPERNPVDLDPASSTAPSERLAPSSRPNPISLEWPVGEWLVRVATLVHLVGALVGLAWFGLGLWGFRRLLDRSVAVSPATRQVFDDLIVDLGRSPPHPELRSSTWPRSPVLGGVFRPTIVVPAQLDAEEVDPDALRLVLLHELAHADRGDAWFNALTALAQILWFFLPHLWWLRTQLRIDQEFLADRKAAGPLGETTQYARWLVGLSSGRAPRLSNERRADVEDSGTQQTWGERGFDTPLLQRVAMLLYCPFIIEERPPRWFTIGAPSVLMAVALILSSLRFLAPIHSSALVHQAQPRDPLVRSFQLLQFVVDPPSPDDGSDGRQYIFPLPLPPVFRVEAEVIAGPRALSQLRIAGCPLTASFATAEPPGETADDEEPARRYKVFIRRTPQSLKVSRAELDSNGQTRREIEIEFDPTILGDSRWFTITRADRPATIPNLSVIW